MKEFILPNRWYIKITDENRDIVDSWKKEQYYKDSLYENAPYDKYVDWEGAGKTERWTTQGVEISLEQFLEHVLKQSPVEEQSYDYLIPILKKLNIQ